MKGTFFNLIGTNGFRALEQAKEYLPLKVVPSLAVNERHNCHFSTIMPFSIEPELGEIRTGKELGRKNHLYKKFKWLACPKCQKTRWVMLNDIKTPRFTGLCLSCSSQRTSSFTKNRPKPSLDPNWCGRRQNGHKYIRLRISPLSPFYPMCDKGGSIAEHRLIVAKSLQRCLLPWEVVHHRNGIKTDNRLENLEILPDKRWHLIDSKTKAYIKKLERKIVELEHKVAADNFIGTG